MRKGRGFGSHKRTGSGQKVDRGGGSNKMREGVSAIHFQYSGIVHMQLHQQVRNKSEPNITLTRRYTFGFASYEAEPS